ncbi:MAG: glycosyltransferase family 4 protein [Comamonadaceae bacterium]|nr:glycosyltransferase family 4 protein [Comamonadaceae bacterium]
MASKKSDLFLFVPCVPLDTMPNGVCTYGRAVVDMFQGKKIKTTLVAKAVGPGFEKQMAFEYYLRYKSFFHRLVVRLLGISAYEKLMAIRFSWFVKINSRHGARVVEMEEAFGHSLVVAKYTDAPVIVRLHGPWFINGRGQRVAEDANFMNRVEAEGRAIYDADAVSAPSQFVLSAVERYYNKEIKNKIVLANPFPEFSEGMRWKFYENNTKVIFIGRFDNHKGGDVFIEAMFILKKRMKNVAPIFVGPDDGNITAKPSGKISKREYIELLEDKYSIANPVMFMGRRKSDEVAGLRRDAAVCVIASRIEILPYTVAESLAQGVPTIGSRVGGIPEMIEHEKSGLLFDSENAGQLADCVQRILSEPLLAQRLSSNALEDVAKRFSKSVLAEKYIDFYASVLNRAH